MRQLPTATWHQAAAGIAAALAVAFPASARAAALFAAPAASPTAACTGAQPCDLAAALHAAVPGDDVTVLPGTYDLTGRPTLSVRADITLHGVPGQPRPTLLGDNVAGVLQIESPGAVVSDLAVEGVNSVAKGLRVAQGTADRMFVHVTAPLSDACDMDGGVLRNSVCWAGDAARSGLHMHAELADLSATVIGSTIVGPVGIREKVLPGRIGRLTVDSSIIMSSTGGPDIETKEFGEHHVDTSYCNFDNFSGRGITATAEQTAPPALVDPAHGDFHELSGSPTVDAGSPLPGIDRGAFDLDGERRVMGAGLDIGADELTAATPTASTPATTTPTHPAAVRPPAVWAVSVVRGARVRFVVDRATLVRIRVAALTGRRPAVSVLVHAKPGVNVVALPGTRARRAGRYRVSVKPANGTAGSALFRVAARAPSSARRRSRAAAR
jgi:hypothetical protein